MFVLQKSESGKIRSVVKTGDRVNRKMNYLSCYLKEGLHGSPLSTLFAGEDGNELIDLDLVDAVRDDTAWKVPKDQGSSDERQSKVSIAVAMMAVGDGVLIAPFCVYGDNFVYFYHDYLSDAVSIPMDNAQKLSEGLLYAVMDATGKLGEDDTSSEEEKQRRLQQIRPKPTEADFKFHCILMLLCMVKNFEEGENARHVEDFITRRKKTFSATMGLDPNMIFGNQTYLKIAEGFVKTQKLMKMLFNFASTYADKPELGSTRTLLAYSGMTIVKFINSFINVQKKTDAHGEHKLREEAGAYSQALSNCKQQFGEAEWVYMRFLSSGAIENIRTTYPNLAKASIEYQGMIMGAQSSVRNFQAGNIPSTIPGLETKVTILASQLTINVTTKPTEMMKLGAQLMGVDYEKALSQASGPSLGSYPKIDAAVLSGIIEAIKLLPTQIQTVSSGAQGQDPS